MRPIFFTWGWISEPVSSTPFDIKNWMERRVLPCSLGLHEKKESLLFFVVGLYIFRFYLISGGSCVRRLSSFRPERYIYNDFLCFHMYEPIEPSDREPVKDCAGVCVSCDFYWCEKHPDHIRFLRDLAGIKRML